MAKAYGFNGIRKHQKADDPRFYYWCDRLGVLVWGEVASAYEFCPQEVHNISRDLQEFIQRDYNHPCIMAWVPLNESWGVRKIKTDFKQQHFGESLYHLCKALDPTRLVSTNDGWENVTGDIVGIHDYEQSGEVLRRRYTSEQMQNIESFYPGRRRVFALGYKHQHEAIMMTEFGGIALSSDTTGEAWGYDNMKTGEALAQRYTDLVNAIMDISAFSGFCYTQLTDVYQEKNGLMDMHHNVKIPIELIAKANSREA